MRGIHESHFGPGVSIRYASTDSTRQTIPWVEYRNSSTNEVRSYAIEGAKPDAGKLLNYTMQCVDCHNRPTHTFQLPERAVNRAMALGWIPVSLPFIKKKALEALQVKYASSEEADKKSLRRSVITIARSNRRHITPVREMSRPRPTPFSPFITTTCFPILESHGAHTRTIWVIRISRAVSAATMKLMRRLTERPSRRTAAPVTRLSQFRRHRPRC